MSELLDKIKSRRSIRKFKSDAVPEDILDKIIEAGTYAATGMNKQSPIIVAVTNRETRDKLSRVNCKIGGWNEDFDPFYGAPAVLIVLADKSCENGIYDGSLVIGNLMLAAHDLGIGSCWVHRAKEEFEMPEWKQWLKNLGVDGEYIGIGHCVLGYVDGDYPDTPKRKPDWVYRVR